MSNLYNIVLYKKGYSFETDSGLKYYFYFLDVSELYRNYPKIKNKMFSFGFEQITEGPTKRIDKKISNTIINALATYFEKNPKNILTYTCESLDGRHHCRNKLFQKWFEAGNNGLLNNINLELKVIGDSTTYASAIFLEDNRFRANILQAFVSISLEIETGVTVTYKLPNKVKNKVFSKKKK